MSEHSKITLVGAGLAGSLLSVYLAKHGFQVEVFERRPDMRLEEISAGRSINLALSARGLHALGEVGLRDQMLNIAIPMKGRMLHDLDGKLSFVPYGRTESEVINSISRAELNKLLMSIAEEHGATIHFGQCCTGFDVEDGLLQITDETTGDTQSLNVPRVIGTDGSASAVRDALLTAGQHGFSKVDLEHGYKELTIPAGTDGAFKLEKNALHIWPRGEYMLIALPNLDGSFTCTLFFPIAGEPSFATLISPQAVLAFFEEQFPDAVPLMPALLEEFFENPTGSLATIKCERWFYKDKACILGDAAHAIVPFFGQGMNCGFEDCSTLNRCLETYSPDWQRVFEEMQELRKVNADAIAELSLANYHEMRDHVTDPKFVLRRQVEFALEARYPDRFIPKYSMVSFHRFPYAEVLRRGKIQDEILDELCVGIDDVAKLDQKRAESLLTTKLSRFEDI